MQERPIVVRQGGSRAMMFGVVAIVAILAIALFYFQPWSANHTTIVNQQPGTTSNGQGAAAGSGGTTSGGGSTTGGSSASGTTSGSSGASH